MNDFEIANGEIAVSVPRGDMQKFAFLRDKIDHRRRFDDARRAWVFPDTQTVRDRLGIDAEGKSAGEIEPVAAAVSIASSAAAPVVAAGDRGLGRDRRPHTANVSDYSLDRVPWRGKFPPFDHQVEGRGRLLVFPEYLLAYEMGLGKTAIVAGALAVERSGPTLIVCPKVALGVWPRELEIHGGLKCLVLKGTPDKRAEIINRIGERSIVVVSYEIMIKDQDSLFPIPWETIVADEIHRAKSATSSTSKVLRRIAEGDKGQKARRKGARPRVRRRWALSGTPAPNGPLDWFGPLLFLGEDYAGTPYKQVFEARYAVYANKASFAAIRPVVDWQNLDELNERVSKVCHRLKKDECLDLPPKVYQTIPVELGKKARKVYDELRKESLAKLESGGEVTAENILTEILRLLQVAGGYVGVDHPDGSRTVEYVGDNAKLDALLDLLEDVEGKAIIFCHFKAEAEAIAKALKETAVLHTGDTKDRDRGTLLDTFRKSKTVRFLVGTTPSLREAVTLTEAATVIYVSRSYNLVDWLQSQDRAHRIGQTKTVRIYSLVAERTLDERIAASLEKKESIQERMMTIPPEIAAIQNETERAAAASAWIKGAARDLFS